MLISVPALRRGIARLFCSLANVRRDEWSLATHSRHEDISVIERHNVHFFLTQYTRWPSVRDVRFRLAGAQDKVTMLDGLWLLRAASSRHSLAQSHKRGKDSCALLANCLRLQES